MNIYLDIETIPGQAPGVRSEIAATITAPGNYKKPESIAEWEATQKPTLVDEAWHKTSFDGAYGQIVVISLAINDEAPQTFYREDWRNGEKTIIAEAYAAMQEQLTNSSRRPTFIGHYITGFDLRFLFQRSVINGIRPPSFVPFRAKPWDDSVFDTMNEWAGMRETVKLDKLCRVFGIPSKGAEIGEEIDGSKVWEFVQRGEIAKVAAYCAGDVERVRALHKRMTFQTAA